MVNKKILLGTLLILSLVIVSGCVQEPPKGGTGEIKSEDDVQRNVQNMTQDIQDAGNRLNELENIFD